MNRGGRCLMRVLAIMVLIIFWESLLSKIDKKKVFRSNSDEVINAPS
jgi:hypothetical protein